mgnify:CR=1 FL=1
MKKFKDFFELETIDWYTEQTIIDDGSGAVLSQLTNKFLHNPKWEENNENPVLKIYLRDIIEKGVDFYLEIEEEWAMQNPSVLDGWNIEDVGLGWEPILQDILNKDTNLKNKFFLNCKAYKIL